MAAEASGDMKTIYRRATAKDYNQVVAILNKEVDYIPTKYHEYLAYDRHATYVAESMTDGQLVSFVNVRFSPDRQTAALLSLRTHPNFRQMGFNRRLVDEFRRDFPAVRRIVQGGLVENLRGKLVHMEKVYQWIVLFYEVGNGPVTACDSAKSVERLTQSEGVEMVQSGVCEQFIRRFADGYIVTANCNWVSIALNETELLEMIAETDSTMVTRNSQQNGEKLTEVDSLRGMSFLTAIQLRTRQRNGWVLVTLKYFGDCLDDMVEHLRAQLYHVATDLHRGKPMWVDVHLSACVDQSEAELRIANDVLPGVAAFSSHRAFVLSETA